MKRLAVARLWYEANSFSPLLADLDRFRAREWQSGPATADFYRGTATEIGAVIAFADAHPDWRIEYLRCAAAPPGGKITDRAYAAIRAEILEGLRQGPWDGIYLSLHGAMVGESDPLPELHLLEDIRALIGRTPLAVSFDLHANLGPAMIDLVDIATGYKTYPHIDMDGAAALALDLLMARIENRIKPVSALVKVPGLYPSFNMRTTDGPMAEMAARAKAWRARPGILEAAIFGGFAYGDSPFAGPSALVLSDGDVGLAREAAEDLAQAMTERRAAFRVEMPKPETAIARARAAIGAQIGAKPVALLDPADNPLSGGTGDTPGLFAALRAAKLDCPVVFAFFWDPPLAALCHRLGHGAEIDIRLGARLTRDFGPPIATRARILRLTDGRFRNLGPYEHRLAVDLGRTALLDVEGISVIVTESCQTPNDPGYFALHGIDLARPCLLAVKAKNHFRAGFADLVGAFVDADCPGPAGADLSRYAYRYAKQMSDDR